MKIQGIEKVSFVDYEGKICATIFTGGCNFRCPFCHNSSIVNQTAEIHSEEEILSYLAERKTLLDGVTISGGEPCLQPDLLQFIQKIKEMGFSVKLDTNGTFPAKVEQLLQSKLVDYIAVDIKNSFNDYSAITGIPNPQTENIKKTLKILKEYKIPYELRTTLVKEFHSEENIKEIASFLAGEEILYLQKFVDSGDCLACGLHEIEKNEAEKWQKILSEKIKKVTLRGY